MLTLVLFTLPLCIAQTRIDSKDLLGAGGSNFSDKTPREIKDNNGLRTGQYSGEHHLLGAYIEGAWSSFLGDAPYARILPSGYGIGGGLVYEYQQSMFLLQTGLGFTRQEVWTDIRDTTFTKYHTADAWTNSMAHQYGDWIGKTDTFYYDLQYDFYNRQDYTRTTYLQVPLMMGMLVNSGGHGAGYWLLGVKLNCAFRGKTRVRATGNTVGHYDRYFGVTQDPYISVQQQIWHEMDNHGLRSNVPIRLEDEGLKLKLDLLAHAEFGWEWGIYSPERGWRGAPGINPLDVRVRIAAFCDFGILNINPDTEKKMVYPPDESRWDFPTYQLYHVYSTEDAKGHKLHNLFAGIKLTCLFGFKPKEKCIICKPPYTEAEMANPHRRRFN